VLRSFASAVDPGTGVVLAHLVHPGGLNAVRWTRQPVVHFVAIGAVLFGVKIFAFGSARPALVAAAVGPPVITAARVAELRRDWLAQTGMLPDERALEALIRSEVDDELLVREARRLGVHRSDPVVQRRLLRNMSFLEGESERSAEELLEQAYALRMDETDLVVRRRLIQTMQLDIYASVRGEELAEAELVGYLRQHAERFTTPARVRLSHVFLSRDRRGAGLDADARSLLARFRSDGVAAERAGELGDPFLFPSALPPRSEHELAKTFGSEFAARAVVLPAGEWAGPIPSAYGSHLVWVHERTPAAPVELDAVRNEIREALLVERGQRALAEYKEMLRERTPVRVERSGAPGSGAQ
jgi:parvulin-like peptidyl-prolyl isomerase